jgi:hypothetical protein
MMDDEMRALIESWMERGKHLADVDEFEWRFPLIVEAWGLAMKTDPPTFRERTAQMIAAVLLMERRVHLTVLAEKADNHSCP